MTNEVETKMKKLTHTVPKNFDYKREWKLLNIPEEDVFDTFAPMNEDDEEEKFQE